MVSHDLTVFSCDCLMFADKTVKLWKISERDKRPEGYNLKDEDGRIRNPSTITSLRVGARPGLSASKILLPGLES